MLTPFKLAVLAMAGVFVVTSAVRAEKDRGIKPAVLTAAAEALSKAFPEARVEKVKVEEEHGVKMLEVQLVGGAGTMEVSVSEEGIIAEVNTQATAGDLPQAAADAVAKAAPGGEIKKVQKEEVRAELKLIALDKAKVEYELILSKDGRTGEIKFAQDGTVVEKLSWQKEEKSKEKEHEAKDADEGKHEAKDADEGRHEAKDADEGKHEAKDADEGKHEEKDAKEAAPVTLPEKAAAALKAAFPNATTGATKIESDEGVTVYEVAMKDGDTAMETEVTEDGLIVEVEWIIPVKDMPKAVADAAAKLPQGIEIREVQKQEVRAVPKLTVLDRPKVVFEVELAKDGKEGEIKVAADGAVLHQVKWEDDEEQEGHAD